MVFLLSLKLTLHLLLLCVEVGEEGLAFLIGQIVAQTLGKVFSLVLEVFLRLDKVCVHLGISRDRIIFAFILLFALFNTVVLLETVHGLALLDFFHD